MRIHEILAESASYESTIQVILTVLDSPINILYHNLDRALEEYYRNADPQALINDPRADRWGLVKGTHTNRWVENFWSSELRSNLHDLVKYRPKQTPELKRYLSVLDGQASRERDKFKTIEKQIPGILERLGKSLKNPRLQELSRNWQRLSAELEKKREKIRDRYISDFQDQTSTSSTSQSSSNQLGGQQAQQAEQIVNAILSDIPKREAGEIRQAIARSSNKLQALQQELTKRNIKL